MGTPDRARYTAIPSIGPAGIPHRAQLLSPCAFSRRFWRRSRTNAR